MTAPAASAGGLPQCASPEQDWTHTLTPPLFQLLYAPMYQAPRLTSAGTPAARRPTGAR